MPLSHCREFFLRTNTNWHSLYIAQHRIDSNYFVLVRCHFRISSQANMNVLKCSKHSYWPCESKPIRIAAYCIAERRVNSCWFLLVHNSSLYFRIDSLYIRTGICCLSAATQYVVIWCATIVLSYWIAHVRIGSYKFLSCSHHITAHWFSIRPSPLYCFVLHHVAIVLHLIASHCIVSIHVNSCLFRIDSQIIIVSNRSGSASR